METNNPIMVCDLMSLNYTRCMRLELDKNCMRSEAIKATLYLHDYKTLST